MASPPFSLNTAVPGDTDQVSVFPALDRTDKDVIQSWITAEHDSSGFHKFVTHTQQSTPSPATGNRTVYLKADGNLYAIGGASLPPYTIEQYLQLPPGSIVVYSGIFGIPQGFLACNGAAISRSTFNQLYNFITTTFGAGDGVTTFNVPNIPNLGTGLVYMIRY